MVDENKALVWYMLEAGELPSEDNKNNYTKISTLLGDRFIRSEVVLVEPEEDEQDAEEDLLALALEAAYPEYNEVVLNTTF